MRSVNTKSTKSLCLDSSSTIHKLHVSKILMCRIWNIKESSSCPRRLLSSTMFVLCIKRVVVLTWRGGVHVHFPSGRLMFSVRWMFSGCCGQSWDDLAAFIVTFRGWIDKPGRPKISCKPCFCGEVVERLFAPEPQTSTPGFSLDDLLNVFTQKNSFSDTRLPLWLSPILQYSGASTAAAPLTPKYQTKASGSLGRWLNAEQRFL